MDNVLMQSLLLKNTEIEMLAYIQSNRFLTAKQFHRKFFPNTSLPTVMKKLKEFTEGGWLIRRKEGPARDSLFFLTRPAVNHLYKMGRILISPEVRAPKINTSEVEHDKKVTDMRIAIEADPTIRRSTWLTDYEMRCGVEFNWKKVLNDYGGERLKDKKLHRQHKRTPDGYFDVVLAGFEYRFVLEFEHTSYGREKVAQLVQNLNTEFPEAWRLIVARNKERTLVLAGAIMDHIKDREARSHWCFSFLEKVISLPFSQVPWTDLNGNRPSFTSAK